MPKVRLLVPYGEHAAGQVIDVDDATFSDLRGDGKASSIDDEEAAAQAAAEGNFSARVEREDVASTKAAAKEKTK